MVDIMLNELNPDILLIGRYHSEPNYPVNDGRLRYIQPYAQRIGFLSHFPEHTFCLSPAILV